MNIVERVKRLCVSPTTEWPIIAGETTAAGSLITGYVLPLATIAAVAGFIGGSVIGRSLPFVGMYRVPIASGIGVAIFAIVMAVVGVFVLSVIINALAPTFGAEKNSAQAFKVAAYSFTPAWVAGVFQILPIGSSVLMLLGGLYGLYLLYLGLPRLMKCPEDKAIAYTAVVAVSAIVLSFVISLTGGVIVGAGMLGTSALSSTAGGGGATASEAEFDKDSPLGKLQELGRSLEESGKKMEAAEKSGDEATQVAAAMEGLGALLGGGKRVDPVDIEQLKSFVPDTFAGMPRRSRSAEKTGIGVMVSKAEATYGDGARKKVTLEVLDTGGASGLMGLASWIGVQAEKDSDDGYERTHKVGGRLVHEKLSKRGGANEFAVVMGNRFMVTAKGHGVDLGELKAGVSALDLGRLESMKDIGVQK